MKSILKKIVPESIRNARREKLWREQWVGDAFECCFCGEKLKDFDWRGVESPIISELDIVPAGRRRVTCPFCGSYDRDRLLWFFLQRKTNIADQPIKLLHIAPDFTIERKLLELSNIEYLSGDLDPELAMTKVDVTAMDFPNDTFDALLCNHVLEHVLDVPKAMGELLRVVKPGGWAVLQVPIGRNLKETIEDTSVTDENEKLRRFGQVDHFRVFERNDYVRRLREVGWQVEEVDMIAELSPEIVDRYRLNKGEIIFFCHKPVS